MYPAVLAIVLVGVLLGVGLFIMSETREAITTDYTFVDRTLNASGATSVVANSTNTNFAMTSVTSITWANGTALVVTTDYSFGINGTIAWADVEGMNDSALLNGTYIFTYDAAGSPEEAMTISIAGIGVFADWIAIIVVVLAAAIVLGIVLSSFGRKPGV